MACIRELREKNAMSTEYLSPSLVAMWCRSVGTTWTVELRELERGRALGQLVGWVSSGVPTSEPEPDETTVHALLRGCGLRFRPDPTAGPTTPTRRGIGYVDR
jgi:hypothetical protein